MTIQSATVGGEIFLQGQYLSLGLNGSGTLGTRAAAPSGFHTDLADGFIRLGLVADTDGFGTGHDQTRDVMLSGTPVEGFSIGYKQAGSTYVNTNEERDGYAQIKGAGVNLSNSATAKAEWTGATTQNVKVDQTMTLSDDAKFIRVDVTVTNASGAAITDLRYLRTIDPDHGSSFSTTNQVVQQGGDGSGGALIAAYAAPGSTPAFYYTHDERATVSSYGLENHDPYAATLLAGQTKGYTQTADANINIDFALGTLAAGASTTLTFYLGVTDDLAASVKAIDAQYGANPPPPPPANHAPVAIDDAFSLAAGATLNANVLANDKDADNDTLHASLKTGPAHGALTLHDDGSFTYTPNAGYAGPDTFAYAASDGKAADTATVNLTVVAPPPVNHPPVAVDDAFSLVGGAAAVGNVLANDTDADRDPLSASLKTRPSHGALTLGADGAYTYVATAGYVGSDSFTYAASDGKTASVATVSINVVAPPPPSLDPVLNRPGTLDGSSPKSQTLTGADFHNTVFIDTSHPTGVDTLANFASDDILALSSPLNDADHNGVVALANGLLKLPEPGAAGALKIPGVAAVRFVGVSETGLSIYADAAVAPRGAHEATLGAVHLHGDPGDASGQVFFYDTALDLDAGLSRIDGFGSRDLLVTTSALPDANGDGRIGFGADHLLDLVGGAGAPGDIQTAGEAGQVAITDAAGHAVGALEFDGAVLHDGVHYYVYSLIGSAAGAAALTF